MENKKRYLLGIITGMIVMIAVYLAVTLFYPRLFGDNSEASAFQGRFSSAQTTPSPAYDTPGSKLDEILGALNNYYVEKIDMNALTDQIFHEVVTLLEDPYTVYMNDKEFKDFSEDTEGVYAGIGVSVNANSENGRIMVIVPFEGYPGLKAGILPGDAIMKVNGVEVGATSLTEAVNMMKGEPGTTVDVTLYRESTDETYEVTITRELITVPTVNHEMLEDDIGYIRITQFERVTYNQFLDALNDLKKQDMKGLILDLRNNPGGLMVTVTQITDHLVPEGIIVYTEDKRGRREITPSNAESLGIPLLVLVNNNSASASEVLSGAVQDHGVGELVGVTTFGKGLVQNVLTLRDASAVKVTVSKYYTPNGVCIQDTGLTPDHEIDMDVELTARISQLSQDEDVQKKYAIDLMKGKLGIK